jgi:folate-binding protein YgfZ
VLSLHDAYAAVDSGLAVQTAPRGLIRLTGPQRIWFLQNTVTNDVESVADGRWVESCFLDLKGKVLAHFRVGVLGEEVWLDVDPPGTADLLDWFVRYRFRTKVEIEDRTPWSGLTVLGPPASGLAGEGEVSGAHDAITFGGSLRGVARADVHGPLAGFGLTDSAQTGSIRLGGLRLPKPPAELLEVLRIEAGVGLFGVDYGLNTLPQEAGLTPVISVTKGCYVGQEVMARLHFRGHVNRTLRPLAFDRASDPGAVLLQDGAKVGSVTSAVVSPGRGPIGIGMVRVTVDEGSKVELEDGASATVGAIPAGTKV